MDTMDWLLIIRLELIMRKAFLSKYKGIIFALVRRDFLFFLSQSMYKIVDSKTHKIRIGGTVKDSELFSHVPDYLKTKRCVNIQSKSYRL